MPVIEENVPLSESKLWAMQTEAYTSFGPEAWTQKGVPFHITSNPFIANIYARIATEYLKQKRSLTILELGGGSGRLAYLFLIEFLPRAQKLGLTFRYHLTDLAEKNIAYYKNHPKLKPFIDEGILKVYTFNPLEEGFPKDAPLLLIGNYFFDTIPQALYRVENKELFEGLITLKGSCINDLTYNYSYRPIKSCDPLLNLYQKELKEGSFLIPTGALTVLDKLSGTDYLFLAGDKGPCTLEQLGSEPSLDQHGTFSFPVNFHALSKIAPHALLPKAPNPQFSIALFANSEIPEVTLAYQDAVDTFGPQDLFEYSKTAAPKTTDELIRHLKLCHFDPNEFFIHDEAELPTAILEKIRERTFPLSPEEEFFHSITF